MDRLQLDSTNATRVTNHQALHHERDGQRRPFRHRQARSRIQCALGAELGVYFLYDDQGDTKIGFSARTAASRKLRPAVSGNSASVAASFPFTLCTVAFTYGRIIRRHRVSPAARCAYSPPSTRNFCSRSGRRVEEIWYESAKDKRKIQGWIIQRPIDPAKKYPLILEFRRPFADYGDRFDFEKQSGQRSASSALHNPAQHQLRRGIR